MASVEQLKVHIWRALSRVGVRTYKAHRVCNEPMTDVKRPDDYRSSTNLALSMRLLCFLLQSTLMLIYVDII
jgi:hypothetical protein